MWNLDSNSKSSAFRACTFTPSAPAVPTPATWKVHQGPSRCSSRGGDFWVASPSAVRVNQRLLYANAGPQPCDDAQDARLSQALASWQRGGCVPPLPGQISQCHGKVDAAVLKGKRGHKGRGRDGFTQEVGLG